MALRNVRSNRSQTIAAPGPVQQFLSWKGKRGPSCPEILYTPPRCGGQDTEDKSTAAERTLRSARGPLGHSAEQSWCVWVCVKKTLKARERTTCKDWRKQSPRSLLNPGNSLHLCIGPPGMSCIVSAACIPNLSPWRAPQKCLRVPC